MHKYSTVRTQAGHAGLAATRDPTPSFGLPRAPRHKHRKIRVQWMPRCASCHPIQCERYIRQTDGPRNSGAMCRPSAHLGSFMCAHFAPRSGGHDTGGIGVAPFDVATPANGSRIVWCGSATSCAAEAGKLFDVVSSLQCRD